MCGIVGYIGHRKASEVLLEGLKRLEYRGYDSSGIAVLNSEQIYSSKTVGKVSVLIDKVQTANNGYLHAKCGIAHTRWATHGSPTEENAHPHFDGSNEFAVVHNGIIDNYSALKDHLVKLGHHFLSETDSEVIPHLIQNYYKGDFLNAVVQALHQIEGTYGIAVISKKHPDQLIVARKGSPIVIGVGESEIIVASDPTAIISYTSKVIYLNDNDIALITSDHVQIRDINNIPVSRETLIIDWDIAAAEKGGFDHFMLKEIFEQPESIKNSIRGRLDPLHATAILAGLNMEPRDFVAVDKIIMAGCGTSLHAGMVGKYFLEELAGIEVEVEQAAEFRYRNPIVGMNSLLFAISQSGETADTLAALREAKMKGAQVAALSNVVGSTIARESGRGIYLHAGPEISVASTKSFTSQVVVLLMIALKFARSRRMMTQQALELIHEIEKVPNLIQKILDRCSEIEKISKKWAHIHNLFFIGRGYLYPVALEGALKLKEISYIHAEGYHASELKHGPIALLDKNMPVFALANISSAKDKTFGNIQECKARSSPVIMTAEEGDLSAKNLTEDILWIPKCSPWIAPIITAVALQLFAYYVAKEKGCPIDQPRNLAKSVTVE